MFTSRHAALISFEYHRAFLAIFFSLTYKRFFIVFLFLFLFVPCCFFYFSFVVFCVSVFVVCLCMKEIYSCVRVDQTRIFGLMFLCMLETLDRLFLLTCSLHNKHQRHAPVTASRAPLERFILSNSDCQTQTLDAWK